MITVKLQQLSLKDFDLDEEENIIKLMELYDEILNVDDWWHFFREGRESLIRVTEDYAPDTVKFLLDHDVQFEMDGEWVDNIEVTKKYQSEFLYMFHAFSVISVKHWQHMFGSEESMNNGYSELLDLYDRVSHCFLNNVRHPFHINRLWPFVDNENTAYGFWESMMGHLMSTWRMYTIASVRR